MVAESQRAYPSVTFQQGDAEALPFTGISTSTRGCRASACSDFAGGPGAAERFAFYGPGGRVAFTVWAPPAGSVGFAIILGAIQSHGDPNVPLPPARPSSASAIPTRRSAP